MRMFQTGNREKRPTEAIPENAMNLIWECGIRLHFRGPVHAIFSTRLGDPFHKYLKLARDPLTGNSTRTGTHHIYSKPPNTPELRYPDNGVKT